MQYILAVSDPETQFSQRISQFFLRQLHKSVTGDYLRVGTGDIMQPTEAPDLKEIFKIQP